MKLLFNMDGVLVDSHQATRVAYRKAGITMPDDAWGRSWSEWGNGDAEAHAEKNRLYFNVLREYGRVLPAARLLRTFGGEVITSASEESVRAVQQIVGEFHCLGIGLSRESRVLYAANHCLNAASVGLKAAYFDDDLEVGRRVWELSGDSAVFVHVTEHEDQFYVYDFDADLRMRWAVSEWLPVSSTRSF